MGNKVTTIRLRLVPSGMEIQGIAKTDRGTKYIKDSVVVLAPPEGEESPPGLIQEAIEKLLES